MAAGLGFKDFTTGEVLTAADVDGYLMQGVWVFASAAARDAAVTSPQEGNFAYLKDTNVTTYYTGSAWANLDTTGMTNPMTTTGDTIYSSSGSTPARLGIGTTGQVLTVAGGVPSWATPGGSAESFTNLVNGTALTGSSVSFTGLSGYNTLHVSIRYMQANSGSAQFRLTVNNDTTGIYSNYHGTATGDSSYSPDIFSADGDNNDTQIKLSTMSTTSSDGYNAGYIQLNGCNTTNHKTYHMAVGQSRSSGNTQRSRYGGGFISNSSVISSIQVFATAGTFTAGNIWIYGGN